MSKNKKTILWVTPIFLFFACCAVLGWFFAQLNAPHTDETQYTAPTETAGNVLAEPDSPYHDMGSTVQINGELFSYNRKLRTVLFLGIDREAEVVQDGLVGNGGRADVIMLLVLDTESSKTQILTLSRDTMTDVDVYDSDRRLIFSGTMQINMQHAFGDSAARSCALMKRKVSDLLYGITIDGCISLTMDGISAIVEDLGGLTLTIPEDWTDINPEYTAGASVTLSGTDAERFLRYRDTEVTGSNDTRMDRHSWFMQELFSQLHHLPADSLLDSYHRLEQYFTLDLDAETMKQFASSELDEICKIPGQTVSGNLHDEYYIDEDALKQLILDVFYIPAP